MDITLLFVQIGIGKGSAVFNRRAHAHVKPVIDALIDQKTKKDRHDHGGGHGGGGKQGNKAQVKPRSRIARARDKPPDPPTHHGDQAKDQ